MAKYIRRKTKKGSRRPRRRRATNAVFRPQRIISTAFPKTNIIKLKYVDSFTFDPAAGISAVHAFRANSIYDPDTFAGGHQPLGHDQWASFYNHYVVVGSVCKATFAKTSAATEGGMNACGIQLTDDTTTSTYLPTILEQGLTNKGYSYKSVNASRPVSVRKGFSAKKFFNVTNVTDNVDRLGAQLGTNPSEQAFFSIFAAGVDLTVNPDPLVVLVEITYTVVYSEPKELAQS